MRRILSFVFILFLAVFCSACINNYAVQKLNEKAKEYLDNGDLSSAASRLESSIELDGNIFETRFNLAVTYLDMHNCEKALIHINAAEEIKNNDAALYYVKGSINMCLADALFYKYDEYGNKIQIDNDQNNYQKMRQQTEYLKEANSAYEKYLKLAPNTDQNAQVANILSTNKQKIKNYDSSYGI